MSECIVTWTMLSTTVAPTSFYHTKQFGSTPPYFRAKERYRNSHVTLRADPHKQELASTISKHGWRIFVLALLGSSSSVAYCESVDMIRGQKSDWPASLGNFGRSGRSKFMLKSCLVTCRFQHCPKYWGYRLRRKWIRIIIEL